MVVSNSWGIEVIKIIKKVLRPLIRKASLTRLHLRFLISSETKIRYQCNICGWIGSVPVSVVSNRELPSCCGCGSNLRFRSIIAVLSQELFGKPSILKSQIANKKILGMGMSDSDVYAQPLSKLYSYENTYYDQEPKFDVTKVNLESRKGRYNFVISSDVYEHILAPVDIAFLNLYNLLAPGGVCIFSVPFDIAGSTKEHFPTLNEWQISSYNGKRVIINKLEDGNIEIFENLCFHGGPGATLEMRRFALKHLVEQFNLAGFKDIHIHSEELPDHGIIFGTKDSYVISARKPENDN